LRDIGEGDSSANAGCTASDNRRFALEKAGWRHCITMKVFRSPCFSLYPQK